MCQKKKIKKVKNIIYQKVKYYLILITFKHELMELGQTFLIMFYKLILKSKIILYLYGIIRCV